MLSFFFLYILLRIEGWKGVESLVQSFSTNGATWQSNPFGENNKILGIYIYIEYT